MVGEAEDTRLVLCVGINIGDVIIEADDMFSDGINIVTRFGAIVEPGGICISSAQGFAEYKNLS